MNFVFASLVSNFDTQIIFQTKNNDFLIRIYQDSWKMFLKVAAMAI